MTVWLVMLTTCLIVATEAVPCNHTHHCSDCDRETGDCLTECDTGYYDRKCKSVCSTNCRNNKCLLSEYASSNCTDGCVPGYSGIGCNIPCDSPGGNCTSCPGGCDGGYCQLGSSCVSGCVDSYYGTDCMICSSGCTSCNRLTGTCNDKLGTALGLSVGLSGAFLVIFLVLGCKYCQRLRRNRATNTTHTCNNVAEVSGAGVQELEWYAEIPDTDAAMATESRSRGGNCGAAGEVARVADGVYDVADGRQRGFAAIVGNTYSMLKNRLL